MRLKGIIVEWNDDRGFGFVEPAGGGPRAFCHISQFAVRSRRPSVGECITYQLSRDERGRPRAVQIQRPGTPAREPSRERASRSLSPWLAVSVSAIFLIVIAVLAVAGRLPWIVPFVYVVASVLAIFAYAFDKSAAMNRRWRTQETTLHLLALVGGWPGAWVSQLLFRHKTRKVSFVLVFLFSVLLNLAALTWVVVEPHGFLGQLLWQIEGS
jgi:uncharacterized membrane protein YsdA (DUF1294 family)/cold shock CspA family protein